MRGSVLLNFDEFTDNLELNAITVSVAGVDRYIRYIDGVRLYTIPIETGQVCTITITPSVGNVRNNVISVSRTDYTTDDVGGDKGIKDTYIGGTSSTGTTTYSFTATTRNDAYGFAYVINGSEYETMATNGGFAGRSVPFLVGLAFDAEILSTGKILVGHRYATYGGTAVRTVTRLLNNGTLDTSFITTGITSNTMTYDLKEQRDGKILVAGLQSGAFNLKRINSDGSLDTSFIPLLFAGATAFNEERIEFQSDDKIIYGNDFQSALSGYTGIMRLNTNGSIDTTFNSGGIQFSGSVSSQVTDIYVYPDDKILMAGVFSKYNGVFCNSLIRLNADGSVDPSFTLNPNTGVTANLFINDIEVLPDGKILVGCDGSGPNTYFGIKVGLLFRLNADGTFDYSFPYDKFLPNNAGGSINDIYQMVDGSLIIGGGFNSYSGFTQPNLLKLNSDGTFDTAFTPPAINGSITDIEMTIDGGLLCAGSMTTLGAQTSGGIIKVNPINGSSLIT